MRLALIVLTTAPLARALAEAPCPTAEEGLAAVRCAIEAVAAEALCEPLHPRLARQVRRRTRRALRLVDRAAGVAKPARTARRLERAGRHLERIVGRATKLADSTSISAACAASLTARVGVARGLLAELAAEVPTAPPGLPGFVAGYRTWTRLNATPIPPRAGGDAHFGTKDVFVNQPREALAPAGPQRFPYPDGTIVVKESTRAGAGFPHLVAIMRKRTGSDPRHGDWTFVEFTRGSPGAAFSAVARDAICWNCHEIAADTDWVYTVLE